MDDDYFDDTEYDPNGHEDDEEDVAESEEEKEGYDSDENKSISSEDTDDNILDIEKENDEDFEEDETEEIKVKDKEKKVKIVDPSKRITRPNMTKFEYSYLISQRAIMVENGSPLMIPETPYRNAIDIAREETDKGLNPIILRRPLPNGSIEEWKCNELIPTKIFS